jgi:hypothetical protein
MEFAIILVASPPSCFTAPFFLALGPSQLPVVVTLIAIIHQSGSRNRTPTGEALATPQLLRFLPRGGPSIVTVIAIEGITSSACLCTTLLSLPVRPSMFPPVIINGAIYGLLRARGILAAKLAVGATPIAFLSCP